MATGGDAAALTYAPAVHKLLSRVQAAGIVDGSCDVATGFGEVLTEVLMFLGMIHVQPDSDYRDSLPAILCSAAPTIIQGALKVAKGAAVGSLGKRAEITISYAELEALFSLVTEVCKTSKTIYITHKAYVGGAETKGANPKAKYYVAVPTGDGLPKKLASDSLASLKDSAAAAEKGRILPQQATQRIMNLWPHWLSRLCQTAAKLYHADQTLESKRVWKATFNR